MFMVVKLIFAQKLRNSMKPPAVVFDVKVLSFFCLASEFLLQISSKKTVIHSVLLLVTNLPKAVECTRNICSKRQLCEFSFHISSYPCMSRWTVRIT